MCDSRPALVPVVILLGALAGPASAQQPEECMPGWRIAAGASCRWSGERGFVHVGLRTASTLAVEVSLDDQQFSRVFVGLPERGYDFRENRVADIISGNATLPRGFVVEFSDLLLRVNVRSATVQVRYDPAGALIVQSTADLNYLN